jgi:N-acetylmuramoyl-L-alanine amidase
MMTVNVNRHFLKKYFNMLLIAVALIFASSAAVVLADQNKIEVKASVVNVRTGPGLAYDVLDKVKSGTQLDIMGEKNGWYQVRLNMDKIGWVASWLVDNTEIGLNTSHQVAKLNTSNVPIYQQADANSTVLETGSVNASVTVLYTTNGWTQIKYNQNVGWVKSTQLNISSASSTQAQSDASTSDSGQTVTMLTTKQDNTKLRSTPNANGTIVTVLSNDTPLTYIKTSGQWYQAKTSTGQTGYVANWVVTKRDVNTAPIVKPTNLSKATIVLDPGHGGSDSGAVSTSGKFEKTYTLKVVEMVAAKLREAGANVVLTRSTDTTVDLAKRPKIANSINADAFVSFHFDSTQTNNDASGITTYYYNTKKDSALAKTMSQNLSRLPLPNKGTMYGNFQVLRDNDRPAILMELGYINTAKDFKAISSEQYQEAVAEAVYKGLNQYFQ